MIVSTLWDFTGSWLAPTPLFVLLNLIIATIALTSRLTSQGKPYGYHHRQQYVSDTFNLAPQLTRVPSFLERVKSINFSIYKFDDAGNFAQLTVPDHYSAPLGSPKLGRAPSLLERVRSFNLSLYRSEQPEPEPTVRSLEPEPEVHLQEQQLMKRSKSSEAPAKATAAPHQEKMKKSNSEKTASSAGRREEKESQDTVERRRPATARIEKTASFSNDEEINVRADDFINRFKHQLRLQRLDSIRRYKEMLNGGSASSAGS